MERRRLRIKAALVASMTLLVSGCDNPLFTTIKQIVDDALAPKLPSMVLEQDVITVPDGGVFDCGSIAESTTRDVTFTINNTGSGQLELTNIPPVALSGSEFSVMQQPSPLVPAGGSTDFVIRFAPLTIGSKSGTIYVPSNDDAIGTFTFTVLGTGTVGAQPAIQVRQGGEVLPDDSGAYSFGNVLYNTSSGAVTFTIDNIGSANLHLGSVTRGGTSAASYSNSAPAAATVAPGSSTTFTVTFLPTTTGSLAATIEVASDDPLNTTHTFNISGTGTAPEINLKQGSTSIASGGSYAFGTRKVSTATDIVFTIENVAPGNGNLLLSGTPKVAVSGADAGMFVVTSQPASPVAAGISTTFTVRFTPSSEGAKTAALSVANNDQNENPYTVNLTGSGMAAAYVSPGGAPGNSGLLPAAPKSTIADGITVAQANGLSEVRIALGTYTISATINMVPGISLMGCYSANFLSRSYSNVSTLSMSAGLYPGILVDGATFTNATMIDGLTIESTSQGGYGIQLSNSAAPVISNNSISLVDSNANGSYIIGILVSYTGGNIGNPIIAGNTVKLNKTASTASEGIRGIHIASMASGSGLVVERNRVSARGNVRTDGIRLASSVGVVLKNNIVSVENTTGACYAIVADSSSVVVSNNTVSAKSASGGQYGFYGGSGTTATLVNNIFCTPRYYGSALYMSSTSISYGWNLMFYYTSIGSGGTPLGSNPLYTSDIFTSVFTGARDTDLSNGDSSNYHLSDSGTYAYNLGTNTNTAAYGYVANDIDGEARPKATTFDIGADEK
jgi:hypothetical protein